MIHDKAMATVVNCYMYIEADEGHLDLEWKV